MSRISRHSSYAEKVIASRNRRRMAGRIILVVIIISLAHTFFLQAYLVRSNVMEPGVLAGDTILSSPLPTGARTLFGKLPPLTRPKRGELLLVTPDVSPSITRVERAWDSIARFMTLQRYSPLAKKYGKGDISLSVCRLIGLPGDTIRQKGKLFEIRPEGQREFVSEFAISSYRYSLGGIDPVSAIKEITLADNEYFVAGDNRSIFTGSPLWGAISPSRIDGRVFAIVWPPDRIASR